MVEDGVLLSSMQVGQELDGQLARQVRLRGFASIGILEIRLRWLAAIGVLLGTWIVSSLLNIPIETLPLYAIGLCMLVYNAAMRIYLDRRFAFPRRASGFDYDSLLRFYWRGLEQEGASEAARFDRFVKVQLSLDWLAMILLVHFTGGVTSPLLFFFVFHLIIASILLSPRACYSFATVAALAVGGLALLEYAGLIPAASLGFVADPLQLNGAYVAGVLFFFTASLYMSVYLTTTLTRSLRQRDEELLRLQQQLSEAYLLIQTLYNVTRAAGSTLRLEQVLQVITQSAAEAMQVKACAIMLAGEGSPLMDTVAASGLSEAFLSTRRAYIEKIHYITETLSSGQPTIVADTSRDERILYPEALRAEGIASILCVPLSIRGRAEGVICVYSGNADQFVGSDAEFLSALASSGATAIDNARVYEALAEADRAKSDFVRMVTHEFRSPLSAVQSMLRLLELGVVGPLTEKQQDLVERSQRRISVLLSMVGDLLELAAGKMEMLRSEKELVNLSDIIAKTTELLQTRAEEKGIAYKVEMAEEPLVLAGFEDGLERVIMNLVSNAVKYTPEGGSVKVKVWREVEQIRLAVSDTGIGIPEEAMPRIFTEFYRAKNAKAMEVEGTGLGLVIAKDVIDQHGGQISVESTVGKGTTVNVCLPRS
ncbi:MAG: GAF domain-containing sensor histidine kinase [Anaerolineae bacterium]|jgi:signal transduction histidine kinase